MVSQNMTADTGAIEKSEVMFLASVKQEIRYIHSGMASVLLISVSLLYMCIEITLIVRVPAYT